MHPVAHWSHDPEYQRNRKIVRARRDDCARCGGPIDYSAQRGPWAFHCGHVVARAEGGSHELANLQAEHAKCSVDHGARLGARRRYGPLRSRRPSTAARW